jgi:hypothetical protein
VSYLYFLEGFLKNLSKIKVARGDAIGWRTALEAWRPRVRFPMV